MRPRPSYSFPSCGRYNVETLPAHPQNDRAQDTIRAQAMLAVGNLSWSLHRVRTQGTTAATIVRSDPCDRSTSSSISNGNSGSNVVVQDLDYNRPPDPRAGELVSLPRLRSLCDAATRLVATEPDHAAGSAARALGYLAWALDPEGIGGGGVGRRGRREVSTVLPTNGESETKDRRLQDEAVSTLAARLDSAVGGTGGSTADSAFRKGDRKLDGPAAKCRCGKNTIPRGFLENAPITFSPQ